MIKYPPLETVTAPTLKTNQAAFYLNRQEQTLRVWSSTGEGPIKPIYIMGRLAWPTDKIRKLLGVSYKP